MLVASLIAAAFALVVVAAVAWPLATRRADDPLRDPCDDARLAVEEDLQRAIDALREIDTDHRAGNLSDEDFAALDGAERRRAVDLMHRADLLSEGVAP